MSESLTVKYQRVQDHFAAVAHAAIAHAQRDYPREACGLLVIDGNGVPGYVPCRNTAPEGEDLDAFRLAPEDWAAAADDHTVLAVVHSHPDHSAEPSEADLRACWHSGVPWFVIAVPDGVWRMAVPDTRELPLLERTFVYGYMDCWALARDYFWQTLNLDLPDFARSAGWEQRGEDLYRRHTEAAGFVDVGLPQQLQVHDMPVMQLRSDVPNHAAIYLGDGLMLHHLVGRLSCRDVWGGAWRSHTRMVLRHRSLMR